MSGNRFVYNGIEMAPEWPARIEAAQEIREYVISGAVYQRTRYGDEEGGLFSEPCHDCGVLRGQYHVELICDMEECPKCHGQVIGCDCAYAADETVCLSDPQSPPGRESLAAIEWKPLHDSIRGEIDGYTVFLETGDDCFVPFDDRRLDAGDVVALAVTWIRDGVPPWETEEPARQLAERLSKRLGVSVPVLLSRSPDSFVGYYVRVRP